MSAGSVGQIDLDLGLNTGGFSRQLRGVSGVASRQLGGIGNITSGLTSGFSKLGGVIAGAFAVEKIVEFGSECVKLGSELQETDNQVSTVFGSMGGQVTDFAKTAMDSFGLSETSARKFSTNFGSMAQSMGFTQSQATDMSLTLTKLSGDLSSFFDGDAKTYADKLKSIFTGETEPMQDELGIALQETNLQEYALTQGITKKVTAMTQAEKVKLCA